ncbi:DUF1588 domain-containing protein [Blastopirellula retiformator]|uniref:Planctomycete cytochrome C n=1 Tax=Blastopirellula retiformator TaxID=2527970 RepID=A0A5C5V990_9BACT|nr:DUF1588 domain-containing protein [Blastopirellula retiformator]TWT34429.1 Planctomycete cytochrome C [Blastopirellula retiformator]
MKLPLRQTMWIAATLFLAYPAALAAEGGASTAADSTAASFVTRHCVECHGDFAPEGGVQLDTLSLAALDPTSADVWEKVFAQVQFGEMPPSDADSQPTKQERREFLALLDQRLSDIGRGAKLKEKMLLPEYANYVDHEMLFSGEITEPAYTPARLWRIRPDIFRGLWSEPYGRKHHLSVKIGNPVRPDGGEAVQHGPHAGRRISTRYFDREKFANPFYEFVHHASGFSDYALIPADQASLDAMLTNAESMAEILTIGTPVSITTEVKNKDSRHGNNHGSFVGGVVTTTVERRGAIPIAFERLMSKEGPTDREDFAEALDVAFGLLLRRSPSEADVEHYWNDIYLKNEELGRTLALQAVLIYIAISPEFVYRQERGMSQQDEHGRRMLSPQELVYAIHYAFYDSPPYGVTPFEKSPIYQKWSEPIVRREMTERHEPSLPKDSWIVGQMEAGKLATKADVEAAVRHIFADRERNPFPNHNHDVDQTTRPRVLQFFREYFGYYKSPTVFKDLEEFEKRDGFQQFHKQTAVRLAYDTDALVLHILEQDQHVLEELLTTNKTFVTYWDGENDAQAISKAGGRDKYVNKHDAQSYNVNPLEVEYDRKTPLTLPADQRCGILTQPSWLVAHSGNFDNDPVRRGKWIREKLLAGSVMDVPITVDAKIPDDETQTLRQRFRVVHENECWRCHKKMNPLGMPFEAFNHVGRFRELEKGKPVDTSGGVTHTGIDRLDGDVANVREMMERLADSPRVRQSFLRHVFRYWMGRNETLRDSQTLIAMDDAYVESNGSFQEVLVALLTSDSFLYRK